MACCSPATVPSAASSAPPAAWSATLAAHSDKRLVFECPDRAVNAGFHVTEVKLASVTALDCGRARTRWQEIIIQIMDVPGSTDGPLTAGKFAGIVSEAIGAVDAAGAATVVELSDGVEALRLYDISAGISRGDDFVIRLSPRAAICKAAGRVPAQPGVAARCCG